MKEIRIADLNLPEHAEAVISLLDIYAQDISGGGQPLPKVTKENLIKELRKISYNHTLLAFVDGRPAGLAICFEAFSTFACRKILNLHDFTVAPAFRRQGLGRALLGRVHELALELDCCKVTLEVLEGNHVARDLYQSCGYQSYELDPEMGRAFFMEKKL